MVSGGELNEEREGAEDFLWHTSKGLVWCGHKYDGSFS
jgi:hypothetical protein